MVDVLLLLLVGGGGGYCLTRGGVVVVGRLSWSPWSWLLLLVGGWWLMFDAWHLGGGGGVVVVVKVVVLVVARRVEVVEGQGCGRSTVRTDLVTDPSPAKTGTGTLRVIFFSPVPVPWYPVPVTRHGVTYLCPSLLPASKTSRMCSFSRVVAPWHHHHPLHPRK